MGKDLGLLGEKIRRRKLIGKFMQNRRLAKRWSASGREGVE
jgi:hypothetical protein